MKRLGRVLRDRKKLNIVYKSEEELRKKEINYVKIKTKEEDVRKICV